MCSWLHGVRDGGKGSLPECARVWPGQDDFARTASDDSRDTAARSGRIVGSGKVRVEIDETEMLFVARGLSQVVGDGENHPLVIGRAHIKGM